MPYPGHFYCKLTFVLTMQLLLQSRPMFPFHSLRRQTRLAIAVLILYGMALGVAMAAPIINGTGMGMICTSVGIKFVNAAGKIVDEKPMTHGLDCSLCVPTGITPTLPLSDAVPPVHALSYATLSIPAARLAAIVAAPMPARGPPSLI